MTGCAMVECLYYSDNKDNEFEMDIEIGLVHKETQAEEASVRGKN